LSFIIELFDPDWKNKFVSGQDYRFLECRIMTVKNKDASVLPLLLQTNEIPP